MDFPWLRISGCALLGWWTIRSGFLGEWIFLDFVNLAFHEAGHVFLPFAGSTVHYLGGTLLQLLVPAALPLHFLRQRQAMGAAFCTWWFGQNFVQVSVYMADARELSLPLVGGGDHDWNELFYRWGMLGETAVARIAGGTRTVGLVFLLVGAIWAVCLALPSSLRLPLRDRLAGRYAWLEVALPD